MPTPRAVVIPFAVPSEGRGLGLGLAALVHGFVHVEGGGVAIAQLQARPKDAEGDAPSSPVEAFVPPQAWRDLAGRADAPASVGVVLTGAFEPPIEGHGTIQLLAFDAGDGTPRARVDAPLDGKHAGATLVGALEQLWARVGGEVGALRGLRDLEWEPLESVLRAERCALHDPQRGGPHDRLAAMAHLGRAIGDAPGARWPVERLAAMALDTALGSTIDVGEDSSKHDALGAAAMRALERAVQDAPDQIDLVEALAALELRFGRARDVERRMNAAIAHAPRRSRSYALLSQALRAQGDLDGALAAVQTGLAETRDGDPMIHVEHGMVRAARGDLGGAAGAWRQALARDPVHPGAFGNLAALAMRSHDVVTAQSLVDAALAAAQRAHPDVLRRAVQIAMATEADGIARASRVSQLCAALLDRAPGDPWASLAMARALVKLGDMAGARARLAHIERVAPRSAAAAEAQLVRFSLDDPAADAEVQSVVRAVASASKADLADVAARARHLAMAHGLWSAWLAAAIAERRRDNVTAARAALQAALEIAPGAAAVHAEIEALSHAKAPAHDMHRAGLLALLRGAWARVARR